MDRLPGALAKLDDLAAQHGLYSPMHDGEHGSRKKMGELRRFRNRESIDDTSIITLAHGPGGLRWIPGPWTPSETKRFRHRSVRQYRFSVLRPSEIYRYLERVDRLINDRLAEFANQRSCLRKWNIRGQSAKFPSGKKLSGSVLLIVHGQWSSGQAIFSQLKSTSFGREFIRQASDNYDYILTFEHETMSSSPMSNATDLHMATRQWQNASVDVVCHGRGGLVARMAFELLMSSRKPARMVFVGCAIDGWGNAYSKRLLDTLSFLINLYVHTWDDVRLVRSGRASLGLMRIFASIQSMILDYEQSGIATAMLIGGLSGASANNRDVARLRRSASKIDLSTYFAFSSQFSPEAKAEDFEWSFATPQQKYPTDYMTPIHRAQSIGTRASIPSENRRIVPSPTTFFDNYFADDELVRFLEETLLA